MIRKFVKRCFLACLLIAILAIGTVACCCLLACTPPGFYAAALDEPIDEADREAAMQEIEQVVRSMETFVMLGAADLEKLQAMPAKVIAETDVGRPGTRVSLADALKTLNGSQGKTPDTFVISLTERHLNACLYKKLGAKGGDLRRPHLSLQGDTMRFAVTLVTPVTDVALSCDFEPAKTNQANLTFELHAVSVGRLPMPAMAILTQYLRTNPSLPQGIELNVEAEYPTLAIATMPDSGKLEIDSLHVADNVLHLTFRRTADTVVAANN